MIYPALGPITGSRFPMVTPGGPPRVPPVGTDTGGWTEWGPVTYLLILLDFGSIDLSGVRFSF